MSENPRYSIIAPCFNEEGVLYELQRRIREVMDQAAVNFYWSVTETLFIWMYMNVDIAVILVDTVKLKTG